MKAGQRTVAEAAIPERPIRAASRATLSRHVRRILISGIVVAFAAAGCNSSGAASPSTAAGTSSTSTGPIKVAQISAHSGTLAQLGAWDKQALDLAFKEKNDAGGVCGRKLELTVFDDQGDPTVGVNVTRQALESGVVAAFATTESTVTLAVIPLFQEAKVPHFTAGQSDKIAQQGSAYVFRDGPPAAAFNKTLAAFATKTKGWTKFSMVTNTGAYGVSEHDAFLAELTKASIKPLNDSTVTPEAQEFTAQLNEIQRLKPDAIYTGMEEIETGLFAKQARDFGIAVPIIGGPPAGTPQFVKVAGAAAEGSFFSSPYITNDANDQTRKFAAAYKALNNEDPEFHGAKGYDGAQLLFKAIEATCSDVTGEAIAKALHGIASYQGLQGEFSVKENGETLSQTQIGTIDGGVAKLVPTN